MLIYLCILFVLRLSWQRACVVVHTALENGLDAYASISAPQAFKASRADLAYCKKTKTKTIILNTTFPWETLKNFCWRNYYVEGGGSSGSGRHVLESKAHSAVSGRSERVIFDVGPESTKFLNCFWNFIFDKDRILVMKSWKIVLGDSGASVGDWFPAARLKSILD